jgi:hypothetical protein
MGKGRDESRPYGVILADNFRCIAPLYKGAIFEGEERVSHVVTN